MRTHACRTILRTLLTRQATYFNDLVTVNPVSVITSFITI